MNGKPTQLIEFGSEVGVLDAPDVIKHWGRFHLKPYIVGMDGETNKVPFESIHEVNSLFIGRV